MIEVFVLVLVVVGIVRMARTRGASPWLFGIVAVVGWLATRGVVPAVMEGLGLQAGANGLTLFAVMLTTSVVSWLWLGGVALFVRFAIGGGRVSPSGSWSCPNCRWLNQSYALKCDSCGQSFAAGQ